MSHVQVPEVHEHQLQFYDKWVMRDVNGGMPSNVYPYILHQASLERISNGSTFPVSCCWNGMASFAADPFIQGLQFR